MLLLFKLFFDVKKSRSVLKMPENDCKVAKLISR
jgi:hypothetical protein